MAFTEFYCNASTGSNINAGDLAASGVVTSTNGAYTQGGGAGGTDLWAAAAGTPFSGASAGQFVSVYADAATLTTFIGRITAVNGGGASVDISLTAVAGTRPSTVANGKTATIGGAWLGPNAAVGFPFNFTNIFNLRNTTGNFPRVNFKNNATYNITAAISHDQSGSMTWQGYSSTAGDGGKFIIDGGTTGTSYALLTLTCSTNQTKTNTLVDAILQNNGATGSASGLVFATSMGPDSAAIRVCVNNVRGTGINAFGATGGGTLYQCEAYSCNQSDTSTLGGIAATTNGSISYCLSHGNNRTGFLLNNQCIISNCIAASNTGRGMSTPDGFGLYMSNCDIYNNGTDGFFFTCSGSYPNFTYGFYVINCNFVKNGGYGFNMTNAGTITGQFLNNGFGSGTQVNTSGTTNFPTLNGITVSGSITYASGVTPWVDPANGDFRISLAAAKNAGMGTFTETNGSYTGTIGYPDVGAAQHLSTGGGGSGGAFTFVG